jgi:hypothetical protein
MYENDHEIMQNKLDAAYMRGYLCGGLFVTLVASFLHFTLGDTIRDYSTFHRSMHHSVRYRLADVDADRGVQAETCPYLGIDP